MKEKLKELNRKLAAATEEADREAILAEIEALVDGEVGGLRTKRDELLGKMRELKEKYKDIEDVDEARAALEERKKAAQKNQQKDAELNAAVQAAREEAGKTIAKLESSIRRKDAFIREILVDRDMQSALMSAGVEEAMIPAVVALHGRGVKVNYELVDEGEPSEHDSYRAVIMTNTGESDLKAWTERWKTTEEAQYYLKAPANSGGRHGARSKGGGGPVAKNPFSKESWNLTAQGRLVKENPELARQLATEAGM